jgi:hypothetical protein
MAGGGMRLFFGRHLLLALEREVAESAGDG